jgi:serine/threonine-protein kinase
MRGYAFIVSAGRRGGSETSGSVDRMCRLCPKCGKPWPSAVASCSEDGADLTNAPLLENIHVAETFMLPIGPRGPRSGESSTTQYNDTAPDADPFESETRLKIDEVGSSAEPTDEDIDHLTRVASHRPSVADSAPSFGSSSDPPTRFLRGIDEHIELPNGSVVDDYEIDARLGEGSMGIVYRGRHAKLGRRAAIKVIAPAMGADPQALARFEREARALASLHHPNIVDVYAFGTLPDGRSYFAMEYLAGQPLDEALEDGRMPVDEALDVLEQIARALESAHAQGIVHRDLKPSNIFLVRVPHEPRPIAKLLDWGLAKSAVADGVERTASDAMIGTALYLSPEQARGPDVDGRTDIYALGCVAYELVLGRHPFHRARTNVAAIAAHLTEPPPQPRSIWPDIPAALDLLLSSMLAKDPSYRPTLAQVRSVVAGARSQVAAGRTILAGTVPVTRPVLYARARTMALVALALFAGILIGTRRLGHGPSNGALFPMPPVERATNFGDHETSAPVLPTHVPALTPVLDAGVTVARVPAVSAPKPARARPPVDIPRPAIDAAVADQSTPEIETDVQPKPDAATPTSSRETTSKSKNVRPSEPLVDKATPEPASHPTIRSSGRDDTINPFAKQGSATR